MNKELETIRDTLAFMRSAILSGEHWSPELQKAYDEAQKAIRDLYKK